MSRGFLFEWCCVLRVQRVTVQGFFVLIASIDGHSRSLVLRYSMHHSWIAISVPNSIVIVWFMSLITSTVYHYRDVTIINVKKLQFIHDWCQVCSSRLTTEHCQDTWSCRRIPHGECLQIHVHQRVADRVAVWRLNTAKIREVVDAFHMVSVYRYIREWLTGTEVLDLCLSPRDMHTKDGGGIPEGWQTFCCRLGWCRE